MEWIMPSPQVVVPFYLLVQALLAWTILRESRSFALKLAIYVPLCTANTL